MKHCYTSLAHVVVVLLISCSCSLAQSVDLLTGRAQVSIPIWELNYAGISVPISIWNQGTSLKVEEGEGSCGMGWNLGAGGAVSRQVRGLPDDFIAEGDQRKGWLFNSNALSIANFSPSLDDVLSNCGDEIEEYGFINGLGYIKDSEPDVFYASAPGLSAQFVFGTDGNPKLLTYQDLLFTVTKDPDGRITAFIIQNNTGTTYTFNKRDEVSRLTQKKTPYPVDVFTSDYNYYLEETKYTSSWNLVSIQSSATGGIVTFGYDQQDEVVSNHFVTRILTATNKQDTLYFLRDKIRSYQLRSIVGGPYTVGITWGNALVNSIAVTTSLYTDTRVFDMVYHGVRSSTDLSSPQIFRYFLKEITERNSCQPFPSYSFEYESVSMSATTAVFPWETRYKQDFWGYANGVSTNKNVPQIYYYSAEADERRFRIHPITGLTPTILTGEDRSVSASECDFGMLKAINYPRGGATVFSYEPNTYFDSSDGATRTAGGVRVSSVSTYAGEVAYGGTSGTQLAAHAIQRDYEYTLASGTTSGLLTYPAVFAFASGSTLVRSDHLLGQQPEVLYARVKEKIRGKGSHVYEFDLPQMYPDPLAVRSKIARTAPCDPNGAMKNGRYAYPFAPNLNVERGMLKKQTDYDSVGDMVVQRRLSYTTLSPANLNVYGLRFERSGNTFHFSKYTIATGNVKVLSQEISIRVGEQSPADSTRLTTSYFYNANFMLDSIKTADPHGAIVSEKIKYAKDFAAIVAPAGGDIPSNAIRQLNITNRHGEVIERTKRIIPYGGTSKVTGSSLVVYKIFPDGKTLPYQFLSFPQMPGFTQSKVVGQAFTWNTNYIVTRTIDEYDPRATVVSETDNHKNSVSYWTRSDYSLPPGAVMTNAKRSQGAYDGFEFYSGPGFSGGTAFDAGNSGLQSVILGSLISTAIEKSGSKYRVSCWAKASQAATVTFKAWNGTTDVAGSTVNLSYNPSTMNTWVYLEGIMDVSNAPASFQTVVTGTASVRVDDVVAIPMQARISMNTMLPLIGVTSQTDDRGKMESYTYNTMGQRVYTYDHKKNLVEKKEYLIARPMGNPRSPGFKSLTPWMGHKVGRESKFSALKNDCLEYTYSWTIYDRTGTVVATSGDSTLIHTFASPGQHNIKLTTNHVIYGSRIYEDVLCVDFPDFPSYTLVLIGNTSQTVYKCENPTRTFSIVHPPVNDPYRTVSFKWQILRASTGYWEDIAGTAGSITYTGPLEDYSIRCNVKFTYLSGNVVSDKYCTAFAPDTGNTSARAMDYVDTGLPCQ